MNKSVPSKGLKLVVGLGNPGAPYANTRHNAGAWFIEALCKQQRLTLKNEIKFQASVGETSVNGQTVILALSNTYMNHSGQAVGSLAKYYHIPAEAILVVHDELDIPPGALRFKTDGGHGGHNGLRDIIHHLKTREFHRLRIGIGHPRHQSLRDHEVVDYVLHKPSKEDEMKIQQAIMLGVSAFPWMVTGDFQKVMQDLHTTESQSPPKSH